MQHYVTVGRYARPVTSSRRVLVQHAYRVGQQWYAVLWQPKAYRGSAYLAWPHPTKATQFIVPGYTVASAAKRPHGRTLRAKP